MKMSLKYLWVALIAISSTLELYGQDPCEKVGISNGWMLHLSDEEVDVITTQSASTNALYFRADFAWSDVQWNGSDVWEWSNVDRVVESSSEQDLELIAILDYFPPWASVETDTSFWSNYVYQAGLRYIPQGVTIWEMWNEPNITNFWPEPNVEDYVEKVLKPGSNAIRKAAEELGIEVIVLSGGLAPAATDGTNISQLDFVKGLYQHGAKEYFDGLGQHPYCWPLDPSLPNTYNWFLNTEQLYQVMLDNNDGEKKIWGTEMGWPTHDINEGGVTLEKQAEFLSSSYEIWDSLDWTGPLVWYAYNDAGDDFSDAEDNFGLVDFDFNPKPALDAFLEITANCEPIISNVEFQNEESIIVIYPNPIQQSQEFRITSNDQNLKTYLEIFNGQGKIILTQELMNEKEVIIKTEDWNPGCFFIKITHTQTGVVSYKKILLF